MISTVIGNSRLILLGLARSRQSSRQMARYASLPQSEIDPGRTRLPTLMISRW